MRRKLSRELVHERIDRLLDKALERAADDWALANRYVTIARKLAMKNRVRLTSAQKRKFCSRCKKVLAPGITGRTRTTGRTISTLCMSCKHINRVGYNDKGKRGA